MSSGTNRIIVSIAVFNEEEIYSLSGTAFVL